MTVDGRGPEHAAGQMPGGRAAKGGGTSAGRVAWGCLIAVFVVVALVMAAFAIVVSSLSAHGDGGRTLRKLEEHAARELPGTNVELRESVGKTRDISLRIGADAGSVDEVMEIHRVARELASMAGDAEWGFRSEILVHVRKPDSGRELDVAFETLTDGRELRGLLDDDRAWTFEKARIAGTRQSIELDAPGCDRTDRVCFEAAADAAAGIEEAPYRARSGESARGMGHVDLSIPVRDAPLDDGREERPERGTPEANAMGVLAVIGGPDDRAAAADLMRWAGRALGGAAAIGLDDDGRSRPLRVTPSIRAGYQGVPYVWLDVTNVGDGDPGEEDAAVAAAAERVRLVLRELEATRATGGMAGTEVPVRVRYLDHGGDAELTLGGCTGETATPEEAELRAEFEKC